MSIDQAVAHIRDPRERYETANAMTAEIRRRARRAAILAEATKRCPRCTETKPLSAFGISTTRSDGRQGFCRACR